MNIEDVTRNLIALASLPYQERYVLNGTKEEYVLGVELLENVDSLKYLLSRPENRSQITDEQTSALEDLFSYIDNNSERAVSESSKLSESDVWDNLRAKSTYALTLFGIAIDQVAIEEI